MDLPRSDAEAMIPIPLGGPVMTAISDSHLFMSIAYPSYRLANYPRERTTLGGRGRMPQSAERMTIREMTDIVEFLQAHYEIRELARPAYY